MVYVENAWSEPATGQYVDIGEQWELLLPNQ